MLLKQVFYWVFLLKENTRKQLPGIFKNMDSEERYPFTLLVAGASATAFAITFCSPDRSDFCEYAGQLADLHEAKLNTQIEAIRKMFFI